MRRERECKGCEGTGCYLGATHDHPEWCATRCLACRGTGRVTDHIPAADAVADAETLRVFAEHAWTDSARSGPDLYNTPDHQASNLFLLLNLMDVRRYRGRNSIRVHLRKWPGRAVTMAREVSRIALTHIEGLSC